MRCLLVAGLLVLLGATIVQTSPGSTKPDPTKTRVNPVDGAEIVYAPGGVYLMGSRRQEIAALWERFGWDEAWRRDAVQDELPRHRVRVAGFWLYRHEVTIARYRKFCLATGRKMPALPEWATEDDQPIVNVEWEDAIAYCSWAGARLPTEAEWEYAARGGATGVAGRPRHPFVWGADLPKTPVGNLPDASLRSEYPDAVVLEPYHDGFVHTAPVGRFVANGYGAYDMAGNVWEWCGDWYAEDYYRRSPLRNPRGPRRGRSRVARGGSWHGPPDSARVAARLALPPDVGVVNVGFRPVVSRR